MKSSIRLGTRGSALALYQAELVKTHILQQFPMINVEITKIKTSGDMIRRGGAQPFQTKRIFTREIEEALHDGQIDLAVHSAKDMSVDLPEDLEISAVLEREDPRDCLITRDKKKLSEIPRGARIGTSSLRRKLQILKLDPNLVVEEIHGNVDTRIRKIEEGSYDGVVLAYAGVKRLGLTSHVSDIFSTEHMYPSPGQGIIAIENRKDDAQIGEILKSINHSVSFHELECERAFLKRLEGGCNLPCGMATHVQEDRIHVKGILLGVDGGEEVCSETSGYLIDAVLIGEQLADLILGNGGKEILEKIKKEIRHEN